MSETRDNWFHERESAWLYSRIADAEPDPRKQELFRALGAAAERQALRWERTASPLPAFKPTVRARIVVWLAHKLGPKPLRPALAALKLRGLSVYDAGRLLEHSMPTSVE